MISLDYCKHCYDIIVPDILTQDEVALAIESKGVYMERFYNMWPIRNKSKIRYVNSIKSEYKNKLDNVFYEISESLDLPVHDQVFSYKTGISCSDLSSQYVGFTDILCLDISDYFYSITYEHLYHWFYMHMTEDMSEDDKVFYAKFLAAILTSKDKRPGKQTDMGVVLQGSTQASKLANTILYNLDCCLFDYCNKHNLVYSRYCDNFYIGSKDSFISADTTKEIINIINSFNINGVGGFIIKPKKTKHLPYFKRQRVLGVVVNSKSNISSHYERNLNSAITHLYKDITDVITGKKYLSPKTLMNRYKKLSGYISYIKKINIEKYNKYNNYVEIIRFLSSLLIPKMKTHQSGSAVDFTSLIGTVNEKYELLLWFGREDDETIRRPLLLFKQQSDLARFVDVYGGNVVVFETDKGFIVRLLTREDYHVFTDSVFNTVALNFFNYYAATRRMLFYYLYENGESVDRVFSIKLYNKEHPTGYIPLVSIESSFERVWSMPMYVANVGDVNNLAHVIFHYCVLYIGAFVDLKLDESFLSALWSIRKAIAAGRIYIYY